MKTEKKQEIIYPKVINRHLLVKAPISYEEAHGGLIKLSDKAAEEKRKDLLMKKFPDLTIKYEIVGIAEDCTNKFNIGDLVTLSYSGATRPKEKILKGDLELISEGDVAVIWSKESLEHSAEKYKYETGVGTSL